MPVGISTNVMLTVMNLLYSDGSPKLMSKDLLLPAWRKFMKTMESAI